MAVSAAATTARTTRGDCALPSAAAGGSGVASNLHATAFDTSSRAVAVWSVMTGRCTGQRQMAAKGKSTSW